MPIRPVDDPSDARAVAKAAFSRRRAAGGSMLEGVLTRAAEVGAVRLYNLTPESLVRERFEDAVATGWRYVRLRPGMSVGEVVDVRAGDDGLAEFSSYAAGRLAGRMDETGGAAAQLLANAPDEYEPRVLRLPEIHMEALWLHSNDDAVQDRFFGLPTAQRELIDHAFVDAAVERARDYLSRQDRAPSGSPRGGGA